MHDWPVRVSVNGVPSEASVEPRLTLADYLRENCGLTGTHLGCEHGACGACTVMVDGQAVRACLMFAVQADGTEVTTVEGIASEDGELSPVQSAMRECHGLQCGCAAPQPIDNYREPRVREDGEKPSPPRDCKAAPNANEPLSGQGHKASRMGRPLASGRQARRPAEFATHEVAMSEFAGQPSAPARAGREEIDAFH